MRALVTSIILAGRIARADITIEAGIRHADVPAGADHLSWNGVVVELEQALGPHLSIRVDVGLDQTARMSDQGNNHGFQVLGVGGVRIDFRRRDEPGPLRGFVAFGMGGAYQRATEDAAVPPVSTKERVYVEPLDLGVDIALGGATALRLEGAVLLTWTDYDPLALVGTVSLAHRVD